MNATVAVSQPAADPVRRDPRLVPDVPVRRSGRRVLRSVGAVVLATGLLGYVFPRVVGTTLGDLRAAFGEVSPREVAVLVVLWASGLFTHSFVLTGALPDLTRRRALTLNLTGSAVANVLPFGGAVGVSLNYLMIRSWGVEAAAFTAFTLVTNLWGVLLKLVMPAVALLGLWAVGGHVSPTARWTAVVSAAVLAGLVALVAGGLASRTAAERAASGMTATLTRTARLLRRTGDPARLETAVLACRDTVTTVLARRWTQLSAGTIGYGMLQAVLLWACLHAVGAHLGPAAVLAGFAVDRVMTLAVLTPGAVGFVEAGTAAALIALGGVPAAVAAGVLLYRGFTFALEIPVGGAWLAGWLLARRRAARLRERLAG